jgi:hypothetical protein
MGPAIYLAISYQTLYDGEIEEHRRMTSQEVHYLT